MTAIIRHALALLVVCAAAPIAQAEKLDDFKEAASKDGCDAIPYGDMQRSCRSHWKDVDHWCGGYKGPVKCDGGPTGNLLSQLGKEQQNLSNAKDKRREFEDKRSRSVNGRRKFELSAQIGAIDKEIEAIEKRIAEIKAALAKQKDALENIMYTITKCTESRRNVISGVADAKNKVSGESEEAIKSLASSVISKLDKFKSENESQVSTLESSFGSCKSGLP